jgi:simple sugar transport system ATP-binding protein
LGRAASARKKAPDVPAAIELRGIDKRFGAVHANRDVSLRVERGTIHGIVGENGAGKSTLMSILYGFYAPDRGEIVVNGVPAHIRAPSDAIARGIGMVHQHFMLVDNFTVLENVILGTEGGAMLNRGMASAYATLSALRRDYGLDVPAGALISDLPVGLQQRVEILKALFRGADTLILDEPTGVLTPAEATHLFTVLGQLRDQGKTVILITHKLKEIMAITDTVSVMRKGELIETLPTRKTTPEKLARLMVGRNVALRVTKARAKPAAKVLEVGDLVYRDAAGVERLKGVSFDVHAGEIVGIAGVAGNGQSELLEVLAGIRPKTGGDIRLHGRPLSQHDCDARRMRGERVAHVPEDRQRMGLVLPFEACENTILGYHRAEVYGRGAFLDRGAMTADTRAKMERYDVRPPLPERRISLFSGGNQQKLVLAREIERDPELLIVGQPTRGVDIGAIEFIHQRLVELRDRGKAILLVSVELEEIRALADRLLVMFAGTIAGERPPSTSEAELSALMAGLTTGEAA